MPFGPVVLDTDLSAQRLPVPVFPSRLSFFLAGITISPLLPRYHPLAARLRLRTTALLWSFGLPGPCRSWHSSYSGSVGPLFPQRPVHNIMIIAGVWPENFPNCIRTELLTYVSRADFKSEKTAACHPWLVDDRPLES